MLIKVEARIWNINLNFKFGKIGSFYNFPDSTKEFLELVKPFGRFEFKKDFDNKPVIEFQNDYD